MVTNERSEKPLQTPSLRETEAYVSTAVSQDRRLITLSLIQREALRYGLMGWLVAIPATMPSKQSLISALLPEHSTISSLKESLFPGSMTSGMHCTHCGIEFQPTRTWHKFCSPRCRVASWHRSHDSQPDPPKTEQPAASQRVGFHHDSAGERVALKEAGRTRW